MTLAPGTKLGPYELLSPIGAGGMGEVWKARDTRLGRIVAIKKVKEQHSERFKQEARSIAALNHPFICQLYDVGADYLVLEYVEGKSLSSPLPEKEAVRLAIQIATALESAHKKGIIHRDLKPSNIMVTDEDSVKLLDFGLAKLYEQDASISTSPTADYPATQPGAVLGTVAYMSPEQAQGQPADVRSDIFSFGLVLYEMLSGRRAFAGDSTPAVMAALLRDEPLPLRTSASIEKIVRHCMAKQPSERYQTISDVKAALEQVLGEKEIVISIESQPSIAVLPFVNLSGDKEQEYFSDGLAEEIINALTKIPGLKVTARTSAFAFRGKEQDIRKIAETLNVRTILEGSVRKSGSRIRISAQLINAADGYHLWSERYDRDMTDVFVIQDEISQAIAEKLRVRLSEERLLVKRHTENIEAYNLCLKGHYYITKGTADGLEKGKEYYEQAIATDPNCALAWFGVALLSWIKGYVGFMPPKESHQQCVKAVEMALELDETLPQAISGRAVCRAMVFDWNGAGREFPRALELGVGVYEVWMQYGMWYLAPLGRLEEAVVSMQRALELDPLSPLLYSHLGILYSDMRQYDRAIAQFRNAIELDPQHYSSHLFLGIACIQMGRSAEGIEALETARKHGGRAPIMLGLAGFAYARAGQTEDALNLLAELQAQAEQTSVPALAFACMYQGLGDLDKGFDWLEKAVEEPHARLLELHASPIFDTFRSDPRYHALLRKMNLEP